MPSAPVPNLATRLALTCLRGYKIFISPLFAGSCRFLPSCSDYASEAVARYGVVEGIWLAARRLARCHPFCPGGHDPVPTPEFPIDSPPWIVRGRPSLDGSFETMDFGLRTADRKR